MCQCIARQVLELIKRHYPMKKIKRLTLGADFDKDLLMIWEDVEILMDEYFEKFNINSTGFILTNYFPNEGTPFTPNFLLPKDARPSRKKAKPLTVRMLLKSAKAGRWLYC